MEKGALIILIIAVIALPCVGFGFDTLDVIGNIPGAAANAVEYSVFGTGFFPVIRTTRVSADPV